MNHMQKTLKVMDELMESAVSKDPIVFLSFYLKMGSIAFALTFISNIF